MPISRPLRAALGSVLIVVAALVVALMATGQLQNRDGEHDDSGLSPAAVEERMALFGYKPVTGGEPEYQHQVLGAVHYAYCPTEQECNTPAGNADHPPVDIFGGVASQVHVWWPTAPAAHDGLYAGKPLTVCIVGSAAVASVRVTNDHWADNAAALSRRAWDAVVQTMVQSSVRLPGDAGQQITVEGWLCPVPAGPRPFRN